MVLIVLQITELNLRTLKYLDLLDNIFLQINFNL